MATGLGYLSYMGMAKQTNFYTAVTVTDKIPILSEGLNFEFARIESNWLEGRSGRRGDEQGPKSVSGPTTVTMVHDEVDSAEYVGVGLPLAIAFGTASWDAGAAATNRIRLHNNPTTTGTIAFEKTVSVHEVVGVMCKSLSITGSSATGEITATFEWQGYDYEFASPTNANTDLNTLPTVDPLIWLFGDSVFRMATDMTDALAAGDAIGISEFTLNIDFNLTDPEFATALNAASAPYTANAGLSMQAQRNGFREVTLDVTIPRYAADTWITAYENDSAIQADLTVTASATRNATVYFPYMKVASVPTNIESEGVISQKVSLKCFRGKSYNSGAGNTYMKFEDASTTVDEEVAIETDNDRTAAIF